MSRTSHRMGIRRERVDYRQVLLTERVFEGLRLLNPEIPEMVSEDALRRIAKPDHPSLVFNNRSFHEALLNGVPVETEVGGEKRGDWVRLVDFERLVEPLGEIGY